MTLPRDHVKAMPPRGDPWSYTELALLRYWIAEGADTNYVLDIDATPEELKTLLQRDFQLDLRHRRFVEKVDVPRLSEGEIEQLRALAWQVSGLQPRGGALEVQARPGGAVSARALRQLADVAADQVVYLNLDRQALGDADLAPLQRFRNLNRLRLNETRVTAATLKQLTELEHLESLNLYGTAVDTSIFEHLQHFPSLQRLYLWQTKVSPEAAAAFAATHPHVTVDTGVAAGKVSPTPTK